jgi:hypothetical protein
MDKQFSVAGVSTLNGVVKYRVANSLQREAILKKSGHTAITLIELPQAMSKEDAFAFIASHADFQSIKPTETKQPSAKGGVAPKAKTEKTAKKAA